MDRFVETGEVRGRAETVDAEAIVHEFDEDHTEEHGNAHGEQAALARRVFFAEVGEEDGRHEDKGDRVEGAEIGNGHEIQKGLAFGDEVIKKVKDVPVQGEPEAVLGKQKPAQEEGGSQDVQPHDGKKAFRGHRKNLLSGKGMVILGFHFL